MPNIELYSRDICWGPLSLIQHGRAVWRLHVVWSCFSSISVRFWRSGHWSGERQRSCHRHRLFSFCHAVHGKVLREFRWDLYLRQRSCGTRVFGSKIPEDLLVILSSPNFPGPKDCRHTSMWIALSCPKSLCMLCLRCYCWHVSYAAFAGACLIFLGGPGGHISPTIIWLANYCFILGCGSDRSRTRSLWAPGQWNKGRPLPVQLFITHRPRNMWLCQTVR